MGYLSVTCQLGKQSITLSQIEGTKFKYFINLTNGERGPNKRV